MRNVDDFDVPDYVYVERDLSTDDDTYWDSIEEAMYCDYYCQFFPLEPLRYQEYCWLKELRRLRLILNAPDTEYKSDDAFENLEHAIDTMSDSQADCELQIRDWLIQLKKARETATTFQYNGDQFKENTK